MQINLTKIKTPTLAKLVPGHIYKYIPEDWYYIYGKLPGVGGVFTNLDTGSIWKEEGGQVSVDKLIDVTEQVCLTEV